MNSKIHPAIRRAAAGLFSVGATLLLGNNIARGSSAGTNRVVVNVLSKTTDIVVNSLLDTPAANASTSLCTLRNAIANTQSPGKSSNGCAAARNYTNLITFNQSGTITLSSALPAMSIGSLSIDGSGHSVTLSGGGSVKILIAGGATVKLNALNLSSGHAAADIGGALQIVGGSVSVSQCSFTGNQAGTGGAIYLGSGSLTVSNSTFAGNYASNQGGTAAIHENDPNNLSIDNSTFTGNLSTGGGFWVLAGGGITLGNTLLVANSSNNCSSIGSGAFVDNGGNISDDGNCNLGGSSLSSDTGSGLDTSAGLTYNGGPTPTVALSTGDAQGFGKSSICGDSPVSGLDQRGYTRPANSCDTGAYDSKAMAPANVVPGDISGSPSGGGVKLTWTKASGDTGYNVYEVGPGDGLIQVASGQTGSSYTVPNLNPGTSYQFVVAGVNASGVENFSPAAAATPNVPAPGSLTGTAVNDSITLNWTAAADATSYDVYQVGAGGVLTLVQSGLTGTSYTINGLSTGQTYEYVVETVDGALMSAESNSVSLTLISFTSVGSAPSGAIEGSNSLTLSSLKAPAPISIDAGYFCINSQPCSNVATSVQPGDTVSVKLGAPLISITSATANLIIGGATGTYTVTTQ